MLSQTSKQSAGMVYNKLLDDDVSSAVSGLPEDFRTVVILCDIEGLTYEEVAGFLAGPWHCPIASSPRQEVLHSTLYDYAKERGYVRSAKRPLGPHVRLDTS